MAFNTIEYDKENDVLYVQFSEQGVERTAPLGDLRLVDYAADQSVVGVEFLAASEGLDLADVPDRESIPKLLAAAGVDLPILI